MPPFASPHQIQDPRFAGVDQLSYLAENMSLNNNNHSPPTSNSGGQSPNQNNSPDSPSLNRVDRTASRYAMVDNNAKMQNGNGNKNIQPYSMDESRSGTQMSQPQHQGQGLASSWATNSASNNANANLVGQVSDNNFPGASANFSGAGSPVPASFDPSALSYALAIQQAILTAPPSHSLTSTAGPSHPSYPSQPGASHNHFQPTYSPLDLPQTIITERVLQNASSYAFYRGNGQYTRLVPLDELPPIPGLPSQHQGPMNGCIVLPIPRQHQVVKLPLTMTTSIWSQGIGPLTPGSASTGSSGGSGGVGGTGRHFDAFAPLPGGTPGYAASAFPNRAGGGMRGFNNSNTPSGRREKIYCDKWVHDGVCAFAQQGCKYKHEMPLDVATQRSLGLFHGLPSWWKREHGLEVKRGDGGEERGRRSSEVERQREVVRESLRAPVGERGTFSSWRLPVEKRTPAPNSSLTQPGAPRAGGLFGNIGSRTTSGGTKSHLSNSYSVLDVEDPTSPASSSGNGVSNNNGGIAASMHAPFSPTPDIGGLQLNGGKESNGGTGAFGSKEGK